jgi:hypothetical protein
MLVQQCCSLAVPAPFKMRAVQHENHSKSVLDMVKHDRNSRLMYVDKSQDAKAVYK